MQETVTLGYLNAGGISLGTSAGEKFIDLPSWLHARSLAATYRGGNAMLCVSFPAN